MHVDGIKFLACDSPLEARNGGLILLEPKIKRNRTTKKRASESDEFRVEVQQGNREEAINELRN